MARRKKEETLVHLDLEKMSKPIRRKKETSTSDDMLPLTLGMILQQARQRKKLKLADISQKLCIKEIYLDALEKGHYYAFPGLVYGVGFLRTYASFLGLDASDMVERFYQETSGMKAEPLDMPQAENTNALPSGKCIFKTILLLLLLYLIWNLIRSASLSEEPAMILPPAVETTATAVLSAGTQEITAPVSAEELQQSEPPLKEEKPTSDSQISENQDHISRVDREPIVYGLKKAARVSFVATDRVWIEVRDAEVNRVLLSKVLEPGDRYNPVEEADGLVLKTANAGALSLYIDGRFIRKMGSNGVIKSGILMGIEDLERE